MPRENDEFEIDTGAFDRRATAQAMGGRTSIAVPEGLPFWRPKKADGAAHTIDIVPYKTTDLHFKFAPGMQFVTAAGKWYFERSYYNHRNIGVGQDKYVCPAMTFQKRCPMCEAKAVFRKSAAKEDQESGKALNYSLRQLWLIWDRDDEDRGVQLWDEANYNFGVNLMGYVKTAPKNLADAYKGFWHPVTGYTMRISCKEKPIGDGKNYEYFVHSFYARTEPLPEKIIRHGYDLDEMVVALPYDTLKGIYDGTAAEDDDTKEPDKQTKPPTGNGKHEDPEPPRNRVKEPEAPPKREEKKPDPEPTKKVEKEAEKLTAADVNEGDILSFEWRGETVKGEVKSVDNIRDIVSVDVDGYEKLLRPPVEDCTLVKRAKKSGKKTEEAASPPPPPPPPATGKKASDWDDEGDDGRSAAPPAKAGKK